MPTTHHPRLLLARDPERLWKRARGQLLSGCHAELRGPKRSTVFRSAKAMK